MFQRLLQLILLTLNGSILILPSFKDLIFQNFLYLAHEREVLKDININNNETLNMCLPCLF